MRVARMPYVQWEKRGGAGRWVIRRRWPQDVAAKVGKPLFVHKFPASYGRDQADREAPFILEGEFWPVVAKAREVTTLYVNDTADPQFLAKSILAARLINRGRLFIGDRREDTTAPMPHRPHVDTTVPVPHRPRVDTDEVIRHWIIEREQHSTRGKPKSKGIQSKRSKVARMFAFFDKEKKNLDRLSAEDINRLLANHSLADISNPLYRDYRRHLVECGIAFDHLADLNALFNHAEKNNFITTNPAAGVDLPPKKIKTKRATFTAAEQRDILLAARASDNPVVKWCHWIAAFTGAITEEICNAWTEDFEEIEDGVWVFHIRPHAVGEELKTLYRPRKVVLHPSIIREGFIDYLRSLKPGRLFPELTGNRGETKASRTCMALIRRLGIEGRSKQFYSWRHTVITELPGGEHGDLARYIVGHRPLDIHAGNYKHFEDQPKRYIMPVIYALPDPTL